MYKGYFFDETVWMALLLLLSHVARQLREVVGVMAHV